MNPDYADRLKDAQERLDQWMVNHDHYCKHHRPHEK